MFCDQSGFYLLPMVVRTYAPVGKTPILHEHLMRQIPGKLLVIWDGSPIHRSQAVRDFLAGGATRRLRVEQLPAYAPDLNPDEGVWKHLKCVELKNLCCQSLSELKIELRKAKERLRHKKHVILGCLRQPGFEV